MVNWFHEITVLAVTALITKISLSTSELDFDTLPLIEIDVCNVRVSSPGVYHLKSKAKSYFSPLCAVKIIAPADKRIKLRFYKSHYKCSPNSLVAVLDGWNIFDGLRKRSKMVPRANDLTDPKICSTTGQPHDIITTDNIAEVLYLLKRADDLLFSVTFEEKVSSCNAMLTANDANQELILSTNGKAQTCRLFLPGGIWLQINDVQLTEDKNCGSVHSTYFRVRMGDSYWDLKRGHTICGGEKYPKEFLLPCKLSVLELHSIDNFSNSVSVRFKMANYTQILSYSALCY